MREIIEKDLGKLSASEWALVDAALKVREEKTISHMFSILFNQHSADLINMLRDSQYGPDSLELQVEKFKNKVRKSIQESK